MAGKFCLWPNFHVITGFFNMPQICDMRQTALLPFRRKACWGFFRPKKIRRLRPGLNPLTWVPEASMLTTRHNLEYLASYSWKWARPPSAGERNTYSSKNYFFFHMSKLILGSTQPRIQQVPVFFCWSKTAGARCLPLTPSSAAVDNEWSYTFMPPTCLHGAHSDESDSTSHTFIVFTSRTLSNVTRQQTFSGLCFLSK
jgi:hypothetical protein